MESNLLASVFTFGSTVVLIGGVTAVLEGTYMTYTN